jgi:hypothetical protein
MLISGYIKTHLPLVISLGLVVCLGYLGYHFREPLKAFIELKLMKKTETNQ